MLQEGATFLKVLLRIFLWGLTVSLWAFALCSCSMPEHYIFRTDREMTFGPEVKELEFEEVLFPAADSTTLYGWYLPGNQGEPLVIFFHGTATNVSELLAVLKKLKETGVYVFVFDYRGFGLSEGSPTEIGLYEDARGALKFLKEKGWSEENMIFYGHSLGAAVALQLALESPPAGVVLESPFSSIARLIQYHHPWIYSLMPWAFPPFFNNAEKISKLSTPLLICHGEVDALVPLEMGESLYLRASCPKVIHVVPDAGHNNVFEKGGDLYKEIWDSFMARYGTRPPSLVR